MFTHVTIFQNAYQGTAFGVMEPVWHLIFRNLQLIEGGKFAQYEESWEPILYQLPYSMASYLIITLIVIVITFGINKVRQTLRTRTRKEAT
jgi:hypothetical protein